MFYGDTTRVLNLPVWLPRRMGHWQHPNLIMAMMIIDVHWYSPTFSHILNNEMYVYAMVLNCGKQHLVICFVDVWMSVPTGFILSGLLGYISTMKS